MVRLIRSLRQIWSLGELLKSDTAWIDTLPTCPIKWKFQLSFPVWNLHSLNFWRPQLAKHGCGRMAPIADVFLTFWLPGKIFIGAKDWRDGNFGWLFVLAQLLFILGWMGEASTVGNQCAKFGKKSFRNVGPKLI